MRIILLFYFTAFSSLNANELDSLSLNFFSTSSFPKVFQRVQTALANDGPLKTKFLDILSDCRREKTFEFIHEEEFHKRSCSMVNYVSEAWNEQQYILNTSGDKVSSTSKPSTYEQMFKDYVLKQTPLVYPHNSTYNDDESSSLASCFTPNGILDPKICNRIDEKIKIPKIGANNYANDLKLKSPKNLKYLACPYGSHMNIWTPLSQNLQINLVSIKDLEHIFPSEVAFTEYNPLNPTSLQDITELVLANNTGATFNVRGGVEALFVPSDFVAIIVENAGLAIQQCFVDASNINDVISNVHVASLILDHPPMKIINLNTEMERKPGIKSWSAYSTPKKHKKLQEEKKTISRQERFRLWQEESQWSRLIESLTLPRTKRPIIDQVFRNSVTISMQDIHELSKDDDSTHGYEISWYDLTDDVGYTTKYRKPNQSLRIQSRDMVKSSLPTLRFGQDFDGYELVSNLKGDVLEPNSTYCFTTRVYYGESNVGPESLCSYYITTLAVTVPSIVPGIPAITSVPVTSASEGVVLSWRTPTDDGGSVITTYAVAIRELLPSDVGSYRRLGAKDQTNMETLYRRIVLISASTVAAGSIKSSRITNLVSNRNYIFRVSAINSLGYGPWSPESDVVVTPKGEDSYGVVHVYGKGHEEYQRTVNFDNGSSIKRRLGRDKELPLITLSDAYQTLTLYLGNSTVTSDVWTSHYSPSTFNVTSQAVLAVPKDGHDSLQNKDEVHDRIVVISRGGVPFRTKVLNAQQAGAIGVIITDDGRCGSSYDQLCVPGADKSRGEGFAMTDDATLWKEVRIPVVLLHATEASVLNLLF